MQLSLLQNVQVVEPRVQGYLRGRRRDVRRVGGFSLVELMASVAILLVISAPIFSIMANYQKTTETEQLKAEMYMNVRGATELMTQEIEQAGLVSLPSPPPTLSAAVTANASAQTVSVSSTTSMYVGEILRIDAGTSQEKVILTGVSTSPAQITGIFSQNHASGAPIIALGVYPSGVMSSSSATKLQLFGDINGDGSLVFIHYDCNTSTTPGTLTRSFTKNPFTAGETSSTSQVLLNNLIANPGGTACFQYSTTTVGSYTFVTNVAVTLSVQSSVPDPQTGVYLTMTKSFLNLAPRNVLAGVELANGSQFSLLQSTPPNLPLP